MIGNANAITYKEVFPLISGNRLWLGATGFSTDMVFGVPEGTEVPEAYKKKAEKMGYVGNYTRLGNSCWFTNIDHGRRHQPLSLMTMEENLMYSKHKEIRENGYQKYDNFPAIDVPFTDAIPADYKGVMGVPISFLDKYCPDQFEIVAFRKGIDGKDLIISLSSDNQHITPPCNERNNHTSEFSSNTNNVGRRADESSKTNSCERQKQICSNLDSSTSIPGMIKNAEGKINGRITYARITIRHK